MKILITGATGLIGKVVGKKLARNGHELIVVSRDREKAKRELPYPCEVLEGDLSRQALMTLPHVDAVIHLIGESVAGGRWTKERKQRIYDSRIQGTKNLRASLDEAQPFILSASAVGFYGDQGDKELTETSPGRNDFLAKVCADWEEEVKKTSVNHAIFRIGVVLARQGGALDKMLFPFRAGVGGALASGRQWMSWIHVEDLTDAMVWALENKKKGIFNGTSPEPISNKDFSKSLAQCLKRPLGPSIPKVALKVMFGEMSEVLMASQRTRPKRLLEEGFRFQYPTLDKAFGDICQYWHQNEEIFETEQFVPRKVEELFPFFTEATNLESITPPSLNFKILKVSTPKIQQGTLIDYKLKIRGVPVGWKTQIEEWQPLRRFVDNQLQGPYSLWHHTHLFEPLGNGTLMTDRVRYRPPLGYLGWLVSGHLVRKEVESIFNFRRKVIFEKFKEPTRQ